MTIEITAKVIDNAPTSLTIPNLAKTTWTSLPGDTGTPSNDTGSNPPGQPGAVDGERTGEGGSPNTYVATSQVPAPLTGEPAITKVVGKPTYTIGEAVIYTLTITLPEGVTKNVVVKDTLPAGLGFTGATILHRRLHGHTHAFGHAVGCSATS